MPAVSRIDMETPGQNPTPDPPAISDAEVEQLLKQAEGLAQELVEEVGTDPAEAAPSGQFGGAEPDTEAALDLVTADAAQLSEAVGTDETRIQETPEGEQAAVETETIERSAIDEVVDAEPETELPGTAEQVQGHDIEDATAEVEATSPSESAAPQETAPTEPVAAADVKVDQPADADEGPSPVPTIPIIRRFARSTVFLLREIAVAVPNSFMRFVIFADKPFSWISASTKTTLGMIGVISLVMGGVALFVPRMMQHNPYATMEPLPHPKAAAEPGGNESTSGHGESAGSEHKASESGQSQAPAGGQGGH